MKDHKFLSAAEIDAIFSELEAGLEKAYDNPLRRQYEAYRKSVKYAWNPCEVLPLQPEDIWRSFTLGKPH
jgi:hypothetical protein